MSFLHVSYGLVIVLTVLEVKGQESLTTDLIAAQNFLDNYNAMSEIFNFKYTDATWNFNTNITAYNQHVMLAAKLEHSRFVQEAASNASLFDLMEISDQQILRQFTKIKDIGTAAQTDERKLIRLNEVESEMKTIYSTAKARLSEEECLSLNPELYHLFAISRDYDRLLAAWKGWRDATGPKMKDLYTEFVSLSNEAVAILGHTDTGAYWRSWYDTPEFENDVQALFEQLRPLYEHLHGYARRKLKAIYGADKFPASGHIPAHLLGNMWAQQWTHIADVLIPYQGKQSLDVTSEMIHQNYTPEKIFRTADDFFASLGMARVPQEFWDKSMLEKPTDGRDVMCHASAWDFSNRKDFRISMCSEPTHHDMVVSHHEMGHIQYYIHYRNQPVAFREGANPGFHEAVGDVISLSVQTPEHMQSIGLLDSVSDDTETDINFLMSMALQKIAFLPFGYLIDQWRWSVFRGETTPEKYNEEWWNLRCRHQGVSPPVERTESDFDPGAKFHIPVNTPYIRYFVSFVIQFQFHKALCDKAGYTGPLHRCGIYNSSQAGAALSKVLAMGSSQPWTEAMQILTGQPKMDAQPLLDYFEPLLIFLRQENGNDYGWLPECVDRAADSYTNVGHSSSSSCLLGITVLVTIFLLLYYSLHRVRL